jgi:glucosyl-3-phosphoglycerate synthase
MDYTQERVATLHDFGDADPDAPTDRAAVVVPMTDRDAGGLAAERLFTSLAGFDLARVVVPIRAPADRVSTVLRWLREFDVPLDPIWCNGPAVDDVLADHGLDGDAGKGRDVWVALGLIEDAPYVALHDADVKSHSARDVRKLLSPLDAGFDFVKGYYARVENDRLYGRLFRLLYDPLVSVLEREHDASVLAYLGAFRYALAGEFAMTTALARSMHVPRRWGLEVGTLGEAFDAVGFGGSAQVDLGRYEHDHRAVSGPSGLSVMASGVARTLLAVVERAGVEPDYDTLADRYATVAEEYVDQYGADARFNDLDFEDAAERAQVRSYADAIEPPAGDRRLPPWETAPIDLDVLRAAVATDLNRVE